MNKFLPKILSSVVLFIASLAFAAQAYAAPKLYFNPTTATVTKDSQFTVTVGIDVESQQSFGADAIISYAGADLEVINVASGNFFPQFNQANNAAGSLEIHSYFSSLYESRSGNGTLATIAFKAKKDTGSSTISFTCTGSGTDTQILNTAGTNILTCSSLNTVAVTYAGLSPTATSTLTPTQIPGTSPTPTQIPSTNNTPVCASLASDITSSAGTPLAITFTCSGVDTGGYINAAEFIFGDNASQVVEKNVGSPGSITTTHTYTTIGSLGVSCRVRDNDQVWSSISDTCKKIIKISPAKKTTVTATPKVSPTPLALDIVPETPSPTPFDESLIPTEESIVEEAPKKNPWVVVGILVVAAGIILFLLKRKKNPPTYQPPPGNPTPPPPPVITETQAPPASAPPPTPSDQTPPAAA